MGTNSCQDKHELSEMRDARRLEAASDLFHHPVCIVNYLGYILDILCSVGGMGEVSPSRAGGLLCNDPGSRFAQSRANFWLGTSGCSSQQAVTSDPRLGLGLEQELRRGRTGTPS